MIRYTNKYDFSVIIPSYNEAKSIIKCIESIKKNDGKNIIYEIIVIDNGSTDGTVEAVRELGIKIIVNSKGKRKSIGTLRNIGARLSRGNILTFLDADVIVPDNWLQKAKDYFDNGFEGELGFVEDVPDSAGWVGRVWGKRLILRRNRVMDVDFLPGRNIFINCHVFEKIKGFSKTLKTGEDKDISLRVLKAGYRVISVPYPPVIHLGYERDLWDFMKKEFWRQGNTIQIVKQWGFSLRTLRNPILSLWHILMPFYIIISIIFLNTYLVLSLISIWFLPSLIISFSEIKAKKYLNLLLPLFFLTWIRWNVSGLALFYQIFREYIFRRI
jgi:glycosyltransferase involved in cell wall biosynthesis